MKATDVVGWLSSVGHQNLSSKLSEEEMLALRSERVVTAVGEIVDERDRLRGALAAAEQQRDEAVGLLRELRTWHRDEYQSNKAIDARTDEFLDRLDSEGKGKHGIR